SIVRRFIGERLYQGWYRLTFNTIAVVTFLPVLFYLAHDRGQIIWEVQGGGALFLQGVQLVGLIGLVVSLLQIDGMRFLGIRQTFAWLNGEPLPLPSEPLTTSGVYALVRHPLYFFSLLFIWAIPTMYSAWLGFCVGSTVYFMIGSLFEEQKLRRDFGAAYESYQQQVSWLIPFLRLPSFLR
ncbi:MAG: hypothetical protein CUN55_15315, partial [Phototrophicales bacterium]